MLDQHKEFARYVFSGGTATVLNLAAVWLFRQFSNYETAVFIGALVGTITTYVLTKTFVFNSDSTTIDHREILRFLSVHAVVCFQIWLVSVSLQRWLLPTNLLGDLREVVSSVIGVGSVVFTGFILHRRITFQKK